MLKLSGSRRAHLTEMRALSTDSAGREVLVGLTVDETEFYLGYAEDRLRGAHRQEDGDRYLELHDKHERVRLSILGAEIQLREDKPTRQ